MERKDFDQLYAQASTGKIKAWTTWVVKNSDGTASIWTRHGYKDGNQTEKEKRITVGKNIGKANETSPFEQAVLEATSTFKKKTDKNYTNDFNAAVNGEDKILLPMLAHSYEKRSHNIKWPCCVQPKLNGVRCLATRKGDTIIYRSRKGKDYGDTLKHLDRQLLQIMEDGETLDGEIYIPGETFQSIVRKVKKLRKDSNTLQYWVYDLVDARYPNSQRNLMLGNAIDGKPMIDEGVVLTQTFIVNSESEMKEYHGRFMQAGFEGTIIRNLNGMYKAGHRSADLQKYKDFTDKEFEIIGYDKEILNKDGKEIPLIILTCKAEDGDGVFNVVPKGGHDYRAKLYNDGPNLVGKMITVKYQELSEDNIPIFPVGISIRDYE